MSDWLVPGGKRGNVGRQRSIENRGSMETPSISVAELAQFESVITWMTYDLNERTIQEKKITKIIVDNWTRSLAQTLVPQVDHHGTPRDFGSLEEWVLAIKEIFPVRLQSELKDLKSGTRQ